MYDQFSIAFMVLGFLPFVIVALVHLGQNLAELDGPADLTKFWLMPLLLLGYLVSVLTAGVSVSWLVIAALVFAGIGNAFFIFESDFQRFFFATFAFFIMTVLHQVIVVFKMLDYQDSVHIAVIITVVVIAVVLLIFRILTISRYLANFAIIGAFAFFVSLVLFCCSVILAAMYVMTGTILLAVGFGFLLLASWLYSELYFVTDITKGRFLVMAAFLIGQLLVVLGILGMNGIGKALV